jgi:preprotein translocase subunit SecD
MMQRRPTSKRPRLGRNGWALLLILAILGVSIWVMTPSGTSVLHRQPGNLGLRLGLDLYGGTHVVYRGVFSDNITAEEKSIAMEAATTAIKKRVDSFGVVEPVIRKLGSESIDIQLPGVDVAEALSLIQKTAYLEFREVELNGSSVATLGDYVSENRTTFFNTSVPGSRNFYSSSSQDPVAILTIAGDGSVSYTDKDGNLLDTTTLAGSAAQSWMPALGTVDGQEFPLTGKYLSSAKSQASTDTLGAITWGVSIDWNSEGWKIFNDIASRLVLYYSASATSANPRCLLGIILDNELISSPQIMASSYTTAEITGNFNSNSSHLLAVELTSGALPMPLEITYGPNAVSATLGADFTHRAFISILVGLLVVGLFMILYYRLPGVVAAVALLIYAIIVLAIYKAIPVTLTLAGIAGFIISLGMAVDANVLIFERMKEELRAGRTLKAAVDVGFSRAWPAIRDSNITTFIACGILYWFGSSIPTATVVMGFAVTLFIGVAVSMFSAIVISKTLLMQLAGGGFAKRLGLFGVEAKAEAKNV